MKFKTIVITKKKLILTAAAILLALSGAAAVKFIPDKTVSVFNSDNELYKEILSEGLPDSREKKFSLKDTLGKLLGFDIDSPETIIGEYSPVFEGTTSNAETPPEPEAQPEITPKPPENAEPSMPDSAQICSSAGLKLNNATNYSVNIDSMCAGSLPFNIDGDGPQVLVMHTHTTECYDGDQMNGETERNTDEELNVVAVGNEICSVLEENGIKTLHDTTYHDYPSYQGSYTRAMTTIENQLKNNPSIKIVLDIHRDAFIYSDGTKLSVTCEQNGISTAQAMLVVGTNSMGLWHDNWKDNLTFAAKIQNAAEIMYPGLMRPVNLRTERFNEHLTRGSLIIEVGSNGNTLAQAKESGKDVARAITAVLKAK